MQPVGGRKRLFIKVKSNNVSDKKRIVGVICRSPPYVQAS